MCDYEIFVESVLQKEKLDMKDAFCEKLDDKRNKFIKKYDEYLKENTIGLIYKFVEFAKMEDD